MKQETGYYLNTAGIIHMKWRRRMRKSKLGKKSTKQNYSEQEDDDEQNTQLQLKTKEHRLCFLHFHDINEFPRYIHWPVLDTIE